MYSVILFNYNCRKLITSTFRMLLDFGAHLLIEQRHFKKTQVLYLLLN